MCKYFPSLDLESRRPQLEGEVFELLFTLTDFVAFKEMILDFKVMSQSGSLDIFSQAITVSKLS